MQNARPRKRDISQFCSSLQKLKDAINAGSRQDDLEVKSAPVGELSVLCCKTFLASATFFSPSSRIRCFLGGGDIKTVKVERVIPERAATRTYVGSGKNIFVILKNGI